MSIYLVLSSKLNWGLRLYIFEFLTSKELYIFGCTNKAGMITYLREKCYRKRPSEIQSFSTFLPKFYRKEVVLLASYPRSGNSYLRQLLENHTGIITGSDSRTNRTLSAHLLQCGYKGEGIVDDSVWIVKSHYPERMGYLTFRSHRILLLVRNPFDAILSYFHMGFTNTHNKRLSDQSMDELKDIWDRFAPSEAEIWVKFHDYWLKHFDAHKVPVLIIRYEDLLADKQSTMLRIHEFLNEGYPPINYVNKIQNRNIGEGSLGYRPSNNNSNKVHKVGTALKHFTPNCIDAIINNPRMVDMLTTFGYALADSKDCVLIKEIRCVKSIEKIESKMVSSATRTVVPPTAYVMINEAFSVRSDTDEFGRRVTELRRSLTNNDAQPFDTVQ